MQSSGRMAGQGKTPPTCACGKVQAGRGFDTASLVNLPDWELEIRKTVHEDVSGFGCIILVK